MKVKSQKNIIYLITFLLFSGVESNGQDMFFSQVYASPLYLSPSLTGAVEGGRLTMNYRDQWPGIEKAFSTYAISFDNYFSSFNSGMGFLLIQDKSGSAGLTTTHAAAQYSYNIQLSDRLKVIPGVQFAYGNRVINFSKLIFADEQMGGGISKSWDRLTNEQGHYADFASSVLLYSPGMWGGLTVDHLTQPKYSFLGEQAKLSRKYVIFGGMSIWNEKRRQNKGQKAISGTFRVHHQKEYNQADIGAYWLNDPLELGVWYRGIPVFNNEFGNKMNHDALAVSLAYLHGPIRFAYSYDFTLNDLGWSSVGAHELSLIFEFNKKKKEEQLRKGALPWKNEKRTKLLWPVNRLKREKPQNTP